jgi:DNA-binding NtrC family response regulator
LGISAHREDLERLRDIFNRMNWTFREARSRHEANIVLCSHRMPVIICDRHLPDGHWTDIMSLVAPLVEPPWVIVMSDAVEHSWTSEVFVMGGYGVLRKPLNETEATGLLVAAYRSWQTTWGGRRTFKASAA